MNRGQEKENRSKMSTSRRKKTQATGSTSSKKKGNGNDVIETSNNSSDSDDENLEHGAMRKVSTHRQLKSKVSVKEGYLMLQISSSFQKWRRYYFKLRPRRLFFAKSKEAEIFDEVTLADCSVAERSTKNVNCSFSIITPFHSLIVCADSRREMDEWISAIKAVQCGEFYEPRQFFMENLSGGHNWYTCTHARPTYCNVCRDVLSGVMNHGLSCEVCKFKAHKRCAAKSLNNCKWATLSTVGKNIIEDEDGVWIPHQWMEGNLPVSAKCVICDKTCGSVLRLQDWRCLWCRAMVHTSCRSQLPATCPLGPCKMSVVPPTALNSIDSDGYWQAIPTGQCSSPLLVFVNSKSGDNQGVKFLRRFRQFLNPAQVFDLMCTGPRAGLKMFQKFDTFRILVCGGDGSVGWVLTEMDKMNLHKKAQVGVLPLGTGNDLAQVMGWGNVCDDDTQVPAILERYERASAKLLDRWSIMTYEGPIHAASAPVLTTVTDDTVQSEPPPPMSDYELTVANHLSKILNSDQNSEVIKSAAVLCETIKDFVSKVASDDNTMTEKCQTLDEKLNSLLTTLNEESKAAEDEQKRVLRRKLRKTTLNKKESIKEEDENAIDEKIEIPLATLKEETSVESQTKQPPLSTDQTASAVVTKVKIDTNFNGNRTSATASSGATAPNPTRDDSPSNSSSDSSSGKTDESMEMKNIPKTSGTFRSREQLMLRANSLKKAVRQIIEHTEKAVDEQNEQTLQNKLPTQHEEDETMSNRSPLSSTTSNKSENQQQTNNLLSIPEPGNRPLFRLSVGSTGSIPDEISASSSVPSTLSTLDTSTSDQQFPRLSPKVKVKGINGEGNKKSERRVSKSYEETGCSHVNPDFSSRGSFINRVLLANADALCAAASPLINFGSPIMNELFSEKCVMNNYFGIGLDAKIALDFHRKREEHPKKCSRTKNMVWFGMLGVKEIALKTYKNLEQRIRLECDGQFIPLPRLRGIVVLNIPSFMGGTNFWGGKTGNQTFMAPSYNDKVLEVVAVFGTMQLGMAMVVPEGVLQHHRIAQCRRVKITILGDEGMPLQVDGEAWLQPPGVIKIEHKNRAQMLSRDRHFEETLKSWEDKQQRYVDRNLSAEYLSENEFEIVGEFAETVTAIAENINTTVKGVSWLAEELLSYVITIQRISCKMRPCGRLTEVTSRSHVTDLVLAVGELSGALAKLFESKPEELGDLGSKFVQWLDWLEIEMKKINELRWISLMLNQQQSSLDEPINSALWQKNRSKFRLVPFLKKSQKKEQKTVNLDINVNNWTLDEVSQWLDTLQFSEYRDIFIRHDIRGEELLKLEGGDLKGMGITKVGHVKRIQTGIKDLQKAMNQFNC
ncbi:diacylglycerol kinase delta-like isoform X1 [Styela clava]